MTKHTLYYFPFMGRAEYIRLAFVQAGLPFTNKSVTFDEFKDVKSKFPCELLPVLELDDNGEFLDQSNAILRYVGKIGGLYPEDPVQALKVDMAIYAVLEADKLIECSVFGPKHIMFNDQPFEDAEKVEQRKRMMDPAIAQRNVAFYLGCLEKNLEGSKSGWFVGDSLTIADLRAYGLLQWLTLGVLDGVSTDCLDAYPRLKALKDKVEGLPAIAAFREKYGTKYGDFDYNP